MQLHPGVINMKQSFVEEAEYKSISVQVRLSRNVFAISTQTFVLVRETDSI
jgi:hypothetical protein